MGLGGGIDISRSMSTMQYSIPSFRSGLGLAEEDEENENVKAEEKEERQAPEQQGRVVPDPEPEETTAAQFRTTGRRPRQREMEEEEDKRKVRVVDNQPVIRYVASFFSGYVNATCLTFHRQSRHNGDTGIDTDVGTEEFVGDGVSGNVRSSSHRIVVGHACGTVVGFELFVTPMTNGGVRLRWKGCFDSPVRSLSCLGGDGNGGGGGARGLGTSRETDEKVDDTEEDEDVDNEDSDANDSVCHSETNENMDDDGKRHAAMLLRHNYLAVGLVETPRHQSTAFADGDTDADPLSVFAFNQRVATGDDAPISSCLKVIDVAAVEQLWNEKELSRLARQESEVEGEGKKNDITNDDDAVLVSLKNFCIWPLVGSEVRDVGGTYVNETNRDVTYDSGCLSVRTPGLGYAPTVEAALDRPKNRSIGTPNAVNSIDAFHGTDPAFATVLSNGSVATLHSYLEDDDDDDNYDAFFTHGASTKKLSWGLTHLRNQVILPDPCVGIGLFDSSLVFHDRSRFLSGRRSITPITGARTTVGAGTEGGSVNMLKHDRSVVCCLRGGTVLVVPIVPLHGELSSDESIITTYRFPHDTDGDSDGLMRYVQGFAAGYVVVNSCEPKTTAELDVDVVASNTSATVAATTATYENRVQPLLFHAWPGGVIDVHACGLSIEDIYSKNGRWRRGRNGRRPSFGLDMRANHRELFQSMVADGTIRALVMLLISLPIFVEEADEGEEMLQNTGGLRARRRVRGVVYEAAKECRSLGDNDGAIMGRLLQLWQKEEGSSNLRSFEKLVHHLATGSDLSVDLV